MTKWQIFLVFYRKFTPAGASLQTGDQQTIPIKIKPSYS